MQLGRGLPGGVLGNQHGPAIISLQPIPVFRPSPPVFRMPAGPQRPVLASALQDMHRMATFAVAAYGVQNQAWSGGR